MYPHSCILIFKNNLTYIFSIIVLSITCLLLIAGFNAYVDPYWLFRQSPIWKSSPALDTKQRLYKPLQIFLRNPEVIFIGSSRVYRGISPDEKLFGKNVYNAGISSLNIDEMYSVLISTIGLQTKLVVIGLDYWMFSNKAQPLSDLEKPGGLFNNLATALLSWDALNDSKAALYASTKEEFWAKNGFHHTGHKSADKIEEMFNSYVKKLDEKNINSEKINVLNKIIKFLKSKNIEIFLYISPLHRRTFESYNSQKFEKFTHEVKNLAASTGIPIFDFSRDYIKFSFPLDKGSNEDWLDYSHFSPAVGGKIQWKLYCLRNSKNKLKCEKNNTRPKLRQIHY